MEAVTGAGFKALAAQTIGADDEKLLQRRKQALAELPADAVLQVRVLAAENLPTWESKRVRAVVRVSIVDASSGEFLTKRRRDDDAIQEHERASRAKAKRDASGATHLSWETIKCGRVCQQITEPVCISVESGADSQSLRWDAQSPLVFNIPVKHALDPHAMVFFEILEFGPGLDRHLLRRGDGFRRVAWAFLKLVSATGTPNIHIPRMEGQGKKHMATRLQVYDFPPESWVHRTLESFFERDLVQGSGPRVFNAFRFKERKRLPGHLDTVGSGTGEIVKEGEGFPIRIFAVATMKLAFTLHGHQNLVYELAWQRPAEEDDPTMLMLASASADGTARLWAVPALRDALRGPDESAGEAGEDDSGRSDDELLGSERAEARRREKSKERRRKVERHRSRGPQKPKCLHVLQHAPPTYVYTARFHPSARRPAILATGGYDGFVRLWDCSTGTLLGKLDRGRAHHKARVNALCFTNDGNRIISGDGDGVVNVWRLETGRQAANPDAWHLARKLDDPDFRGKSITSVQVHPVERLLLVSAQQNTIRLFELRRYTRVHDGFIGAPVSHSLVRACFSPDGQYVLSGAEDGKPHLWNTNTSMAVASKTWRYGFPKPLCAASWHPHEHLVAFCAFDGRFPVLMYEALRDTRDVDAQPIKLAGELPMDDDDGDLVFEGGATRRRSVSETAQVLSAIRDERTRRLSAKLDALDLSDDENTRESANATGAGATGAGAVSQLRGIDALRERFMQRRLAQQGQGQRHRSPERSGLLGPSSNQDSSSSDDEESKSSDDSDSN
ncbi:Jouberin [Hondaea fermentalgiana]|uniref:Jouberin n=1 Tax=Hondaea fermentalgiana TaxID=2315210 RepID=A0A2R5GAQ7_9STRA|nr:Jouberin [Hondaea fermentalgiana]|eukprot:GBG28087.1 Jouberin [Hondaea fermentalgiana]